MLSQIIEVLDLTDNISNPTLAYFHLRIDQVYFFHLLFNLETDIASLHWTFYRSFLKHILAALPSFSNFRPA